MICMEMNVTSYGNDCGLACESLVMCRGFILVEICLLHGEV